MNKMIFKKTIICPICKKESKINAIKKGAFRIIHQDIDLHLKYEGLNPIYYDVNFCNHCGYADLSKYFNKINPKEFDILQKNISYQWTPMEIPMDNNINFAINLYKLVLLNRLYIKKHKKGELAVITLRLSYLFKDLGNEDNISRFRQNTLTCLTEAYTSEEFPLGETFDQYYAEYLLSVLNYYNSNKEEAMKWVGKVIINPYTPHKIKEKARDLKEMINS